MLAGFSQGAIVAAAIAEDNNGKFGVVQVVTIGGPVGGFDGIPENIQVLSYESDLDPVPALDGRPNPTAPNWQTITGDNGGGFPASHNAIKYSEMSADPNAQPNDSSNLTQFFQGQDRITDFYATK